MQEWEERDYNLASSN